ncbi:MAG: CynX/NimT family MFS transporter [Candidatus Binataceae bacterium]
MSQPQSLSPYRWVIEVLLVTALLSQTIAWNAPAPILEPMTKSLNISLAQGGLVISIINLCIAVFSLLGALVAERLGVLRAMLLGIWLMSAGGILSGYTASFSALLACRVLQGVGFGVMIAPPGTLLMQWFGSHEWPYINTFNFLCTYIGLFAVFSMTVPIYISLGSSWQSVMFWYGIVCGAIALGWTLLGRERRAVGIPATEASSIASGSALRAVTKMRDVLLLASGLFGGMWVFQVYVAFLPTYFLTYRAMSLGEAASVTSVLPLAGIFAAAGGGFGTAWIGLRKPFTWPIGILTLIGCAGAVMAPSTAWITASLVLVGIGSAGSLAALTTLLMELPGMTPERMGAALAFVWAVGYAGAFASPFVGGALAESIGLRAVLIGFLVFQLLPIVMIYFLPETGPRRTRIEVVAAS